MGQSAKGEVEMGGEFFRQQLQSNAEPEEEYVSRCPACGDPIDYCQGHGELGDPSGALILHLHDQGDHSVCHPEGCEEATQEAI